MPDETNLTIAEPDIKCGSKVIAGTNATSLLQSFTVDLDVDQPDMCVVQVDNQGCLSNDLSVGEPMTLGVSGSEPLFDGEIVALEPTYRVGAGKGGKGGATLLIRGYSRLHRLLRGRRSRAYTDTRDSLIAETLAGDNGLKKGEIEKTEIPYDHVYQHNQTDLEFLRILAARNGFEILVEGTNLHFRKPPRKDSSVKLELGKPSAEYLLKHFHARLSSAGLVQKVEVRGWDPVKKEEFRGEATQKEGLGSMLATNTIARFGQKVTWTVDRPISSNREAALLAEARMQELAMEFITGDAVCHSLNKKVLTKVKAGLIVEIVANPDVRNDKFNGRYKIVGASHRYTHSGEPGSGHQGGYDVSVRFRRDGERP